MIDFLLEPMFLQGTFAELLLELPNLLLTVFLSTESDLGIDDANTYEEKKEARLTPNGHKNHVNGSSSRRFRVEMI